MSDKVVSLLHPKRDEHLVAVYGTLKEGFGNNATYLKGKIPVGRDVRLTGYVLVNMGGAFPAAVKIPQSVCSISCELFEVNQEELNALDRLESHPHFYTRTEVHLPFQHKIRRYLPHTCWIYLIGQAELDKPGVTYVRGGDWTLDIAKRDIVAWEGSQGCLDLKRQRENEARWAAEDADSDEGFSAAWNRGGYRGGAYAGPEREIVKPPLLQVGPGEEEVGV